MYLRAKAGIAPAALEVSQSRTPTGLEADARFYFVHSYFVKSNNADNVLATTDYGSDFDSILVRGNILGAQFHPEKSHKFGLRLLKNFAEVIK